MTKWPMIPLGDVITQVATATHVHADREYPNFGIYSFGRGLFSKPPISGATTSANCLYQVRAGQFIYSRLFAFEGGYGLVSEEFDGCFISNEYPHFDCDRKRLRPEYLATFFKWQKAWERAAMFSTGMGDRRRRIQPEQLLKMTIPLPSVQEQERLVERLGSLGTKIDEAKRLRREADLETVSLTNAVRRGIFGERPDQSWIPLSNYVSHIQNGWSPSCEKRRAVDGEWAVLKVGAVSFGTYDPTENKALPKSLSPISEYEVQAGDFLMSRANTLELVGACAYVENTPPRRMLSDKLFRFVFRPDVDVDRHYLNHVLKSPAIRDQIVRVASGTSPTMKNISKEKVLALLIPGHSFSQQKELAARLSNTQSLIDTTASYQAKLSAELDAMLPGILNQVFDGDVE
jgi:type I restriction enzyme, S subunit